MPPTSTVLSRAAWPETSPDAALGHPEVRRKEPEHRSFAFPPSGAAATRTFQADAVPADDSRARLAPGETRSRR